MSNAHGKPEEEHDAFVISGLNQTSSLSRNISAYHTKSQKMQELMTLTPGNHALEKRPRTGLDNLLIDVPLMGLHATRGSPESSQQESRVREENV